MPPSTPCSDDRQAQGVRALYERLANAEVYVDAGQVESLLRVLAPLDTGTGASGASVVTSVGMWRREREIAWSVAWDAAATEEARRRFATTLALQSAPLGLALGSWLQGLSAPGVCENPAQLAQLSLLADDLGVGRPHGARRDEFRRLLERLHQPIHGAGLAELAQWRDIDDSMYGLPASLLAMSRRSDVFHAHICAVDWLLRHVGTLPAWALLKVRHPQWIDWRRLDLGVAADAQVVADPLACTAQVAASCHADAGAAAAFDAAARWTFAALRAWDARLLRLCAAAANSRQEMAQLLRRKAREASVYHKERKLGGCPLSVHFQRAQTDPWPLLELLEKSPYVRPGDPGHSPLLNGLISPRGPMFGVFPKAELRLLREWIESLGPGQDAAMRGTEGPFTTGTPAAVAGAFPPAGLTGTDSAMPAPLHLREAYFLLQGRALEPGTRAWAVDYVQRRLRAAAKKTGGAAERALPQVWQPEGLRPWLRDQHDLHGRAYEQSGQGPLQVSREDAIDSTLQLAPLILIDGAWLQGFTDIELACSAIGGALFETYWDELGNGRVALNHPHIYRELLASMDLRLAPTGSWAFACDSRLRDDSFALPVYWLCLGKLPLTFMPEILGMNLAMELSGVGDGYREARRFLAAYGFSTQFVDLHNTIDNVATGHSAWAADAIDRHMASLLSLRDEAFASMQWQRVRTGYASLASSPTPRRGLALPAWLRSLIRPDAAPVQPASPLHHHAYPMETT